MNDDIEHAMRNFPDTFRAELAAIQAGAKNGGVISPRRRSGLLIAYERTREKYNTKITSLRGHAPSPAIDEVEEAIAKIAAEAVAALPTGNAEYAEK